MEISSAWPSLQHDFCSTDCGVLSNHIPAWRNAMQHLPLLKAFGLTEVWPCINRCAQGIFHCQQSQPKPKLSSSVTLTAENRLKQYLIKIIFEVLPYQLTAIAMLRRSTSPSAEFSFWVGHRCYTILQVLGTDCAAQQPLDSTSWFLM